RFMTSSFSSRFARVVGYRLIALRALCDTSNRRIQRAMAQPTDNARSEVIIRRMKNRWAETPENEIDQLVYQSRLVGAEEALVLWGGGNNSVKSQSTDLLGRPIDVMYIKSSG